MSRCAHRTAQTDPSRRRSPLAAASPFCSRVPHNSRVEEAGPRHATHALARADPRAALTARPARSRRFGGKGAQRRSASSAAGAGGGGSPPPQRASTRRCAAARARRRVRALARRSVDVRSFDQQIIASLGAVAVALPPGAAARGAARALLARRPLGLPRSRRLALGRRSTRRPSPPAPNAARSLAPCSSARSHARGRDGSTATRRRVAAARRSSRRRSRALLAPARSAAAFATARHSAAARRGGLRLLR